MNLTCKGIMADHYVIRLSPYYDYVCIYEYMKINVNNLMKGYLLLWVLNVAKTSNFIKV